MGSNHLIKRCTSSLSVQVKLILIEWGVYMRYSVFWVLILNLTDNLIKVMHVNSPFIWSPNSPLGTVMHKYVKYILTSCYCRCMFKTSHHSGVEGVIVKNIKNLVDFSLKVRQRETFQVTQSALKETGVNLQPCCWRSQNHTRFFLK